ncbi:transmembrane secretion effector [Kribbella orskensis]|uniref:Transmembrane secretion effector n=2 Tax=Kribbellaceae TaxID=2726069 RepID=A0ABY2BES5_9ACTN|nr:transmembrane secretion effector [Kribbella sp. VKM Ac-2500]TCO18290.1 transmembrane secretion effector [Kribbella orskensis]
MIVSDLGRAGVIAALVLAFFTESVSVPLLAVTAFVVVTGSIFHGAAQQSLVADLTDESDAVRDSMNARMSTLDVGGASLAGPPTGSAAFAAFTWLPFLADALSFAFSSACVLAIRTDQKQPPAAPRESVRSAIRIGVAFLMRHRELRTLAVLTGAANLTTNCAFVVLVLYASDPVGLNLKPAQYGFLLTALAIGGVVAGPLAPRLLARWGASRVVGATLLTRTLVWPAIAITHEPVVAALALMAAGLASTFVTVTVTSARQKLSPRPMLGRVVTAFRTIGNGAAPVGALLGGILAELVGLRGTLVSAGVLLAVVSALLLPRLLRSETLR